VTNYPRRLDLWLQYLDQEESKGDVTTVRNLFERMISLKLSSKKMKHVFKRYLSFEKEKAGGEKVEYVKNKVREYLQAKS
jgi:rRNA biogenesis protein RRP5